MSASAARTQLPALWKLYSISAGGSAADGQAWMKFVAVRHFCHALSQDPPDQPPTATILAREGAGPTKFVSRLIDYPMDRRKLRIVVGVS
jgi:hypothetical protein